MPFGSAQDYRVLYRVSLPVSLLVTVPVSVLGGGGGGGGGGSLASSFWKNAMNFMPYSSFFYAVSSLDL